MSPSTLDKGEFHVISSPATALQSLSFKLTYRVRHHHTLELRIITHTLEERDAVSCPFSSSRTLDTMCSACADASGQGLETLTDRDDQSSSDRRSIDPFSFRVLSLQTTMA